MLREISGWFLVVLLVGGVCGFAWLTRHPDTAWLERAEDWPAVGPLAERFRRAYLGPPPGERAVHEGDGEPEVVIVRREPPGGPIDLSGTAAAGVPDAGFTPPRRLGPAGAEPRPGPEGKAGAPVAGAEAGAAASAAPGISIAEIPLPGSAEAFEHIEPLAPTPPASRERVWLRPGSILRTAPDGTAAVVERTPELAWVPLYERRDGWARVRLRGRDGWADLATAPPEVRRPGRGAFVGRYAAEPRAEVVGRVERMLGLSGPNRRLGSFDLYSDVEDEELLDLLAGAAEQLEAAYGARFGLGLPRRRGRAAVALFAAEADYRALVAATASAPQHARGFATGGLAVFYVGDAPPIEVVGSFVHELTHTMNRRALGIGLPPWLEEGMAEDLGTVWYEEPDAPGPGLAPGSGGRWGRFVVQKILTVAAMSGRTSDGGGLAELAALDRKAFYAAGHAARYRDSLLYVRCLLDGGGGALTPGFRRFLADAAGGYQPTPDRLIDRLGHDWPGVEAICREHRTTLFGEAERMLAGGGPLRWLPAAGTVD